MADAASRLTLDRDVLKVLASDTRLDILKALDERQKTVTELSRELKLNKATVFEHVDKLAEADLVTRLDDGRKWVYWQLSWKGRRLLHPGATTIALMLASSLGAVVTAVVSALLWWRATGMGVSRGPTDDGAPGGPESDGGAQPAFNENLADPTGGTGTDAVASLEPLLYVAVALTALALLLVVGALLVRRRHRGAAAAA